MRYLLLSLLLIPCLSRSQNTNISGVINSYSSVQNISGNTITVPNTSVYSVGDVVLLIQMQGASMDASNTASFGTINSLNDVGNYEFTKVCSVLNNTELEVSSITRTYNPAGIAQLVSVPQYVDATVAASLTASPWNGSTGGILAFQCSGNLTLNADIDVSGMGFRGGNVTTSGYTCQWFNAVNDYFYDIATGEGAEKGEGIAFYLPNQTSGRGAQANGGGGGNDHNSGGAGGSNAGQGGNGGERVKPSTFTCEGIFPGIGGYPMTYNNTENKIFLGGGGGAGHENNPSTATAGTPGGGIILISANTVIGNGFSINAAGANQLSNSADGAGGAGAGGTILFEVGNFSGALNVNAQGGNGGNVANIGPSNCNGPGGGGGGGVIWFDQASVPGGISLNFNGGVSGQTLSTTQSNCTLNGTNNAENGTDGFALTGLAPFGPNCSIPLLQSLSICDGDSTFLEGAWQSSSGVYFDTISSGCCDTTIETTLTVDSVLTSTLNQTLCFGDSIIVNGTVYNSNVSGATEIFPGAGVNGCDSIVTINLTVRPNITGVDSIQACDSITWIDGLTYTASNNTASHVLANGSFTGCDSTVFLNLTINTVDISVSNIGSMLTSNQNGAQYQWLNCDSTMIPIVGETAQSFTPTQAGLYAVEITFNDCIDTSDCAVFFLDHISSLDPFAQVKLYPNPSKGDVNIELGELSKVSLKVFDITGKEVLYFKDISSPEFNFKLKAPAGVYHIELTSNQGQKTLPLILNQ